MKTSIYFGLSERRVPLNQNPLWLIMLFSLLNSNLDMSTLFSDRPISASSHVLACCGMGEISPNDMNDVCPLDRRVETWSWCMTLVIITGSTLQMLYYKNVFLHVFLHGGFPLFGGTSISGWWILENPVSQWRWLGPHWFLKPHWSSIMRIMGGHMWKKKSSSQGLLVDDGSPLKSFFWGNFTCRMAPGTPGTWEMFCLLMVMSKTIVITTARWHLVWLFLNFIDIHHDQNVKFLWVGIIITPSH